MQSAGQGGCPVSRGLPSADIFRTVVIQMRTSALFVAKSNIKFFKINSMSTSDMDSGRGEGLSQCLHFLDKERSIFHDFGRRPVWIAPEQKNSKVKHGL